MCEISEIILFLFNLLSKIDAYSESNEYFKFFLVIYAYIL